VACFGWNVVSLAGDRLQEHFGMTCLPSVLSRVYLSWSLAELGAFTEALTRGAEGVQIAEEADHPFSLIWAYAGMGQVYLQQGDFDRSIHVLERGLDFCQVRDIPSLFPTVASRLGFVYALSGRVTEAIRLLEQAVAQASSTGSMASYPLMIAFLSEAYLLSGRGGEATELALRACEFARAHKERGYQAWSLRLLGMIATHRTPPEGEQAAEHFQQAITLSQELGMRPLLAHCYVGLGTLYTAIGQQEEARATLSTAIEMYRAMGMLFWLPQAEAALAQGDG
jgi:tetratricopeptide (TPR) repeat protein